MTLYVAKLVSLIYFYGFFFLCCHKIKSEYQYSNSQTKSVFIVFLKKHFIFLFISKLKKKLKPEFRYKILKMKLVQLSLEIFLTSMTDIQVTVTLKSICKTITLFFHLSLYMCRWCNGHLLGIRNWNVKFQFDSNSLHSLTHKYTFGKL